MTSPLLPSLQGTQLTVEAVMRQPTIIRDRIAKLADAQLLLPRFFRQLGARVSGGGMLYSTLAAADFYTASNTLEPRTPGTEYAVAEGLEPEPKLALVEDYGAKVQILDEEVLRNDVNRVDQQTVQLTNTLLRKLDTRAVAALAAAPIATVAVSNPWNALTFVGPEANLTISANRPTAHFAQAQELFDLDEMGVVADTLVLHPSQARALREAYAENLGAMLESVGLELFSNPRIPEGTAYVCQGGQVGQVGWELPLTVEVIDDRKTRSRWIQVFAVPAIATDRPYACKKIVGLGT
jgi:hypothetical protein